MTTNATADTTTEKNDEDPRYAFDPELLVRQGRSVSVVLEARLCEAAKRKLKKSPESLSYKEFRALFTANCADQEGYLSPQHPVVETVARMLLAAPKDAMRLSEIYEQLSELWLTSTWSPSLTIDAMRRLLDHAAGQGIVRV